jgi:uncharacterized protein YbgA (DUF1722 family)/uncharacterized protein YbbK (DUF523 family)
MADLPADTDRETHPRPVVVASACLGFAACRYNGQQLAAGFLEVLGAHAELVPICPEVEIGLGTPRPTIHIERIEGRDVLLQPETGRELTTEMQDWSQSWLASQVSARGSIHGFVLKGKSPSCGVSDTKILARGGQSSVATGSGLFTRAVQEQFPEAAVEDEGRLTNLAIREHWLTHVFTSARFQQLDARHGLGPLVEFHAQHKFLLQAQDEVGMRELGQLVGTGKELGVETCYARYGARLHQALAARPSPKRHANVLQHVLGFFKDRVGAEEKALFLDILNGFLEKRLPLSAPVAVLRSWSIRFEESYLLAQRYFEPFPVELVSKTDSGHPRRF